MARTRKPLVTERDVKTAAAGGQRQLDVRGAAVTPAARDAARQLGIDLAVAPGVEPLPAASPAIVASPLRIAVGADHGGVTMKDTVLAALRAKGHSVDDLGTFGPDAVDYPDFAVAVARTVAAGAADMGIMIDGAGIGSCMAANKVPGVRAAMCHDVTTAANAREHNNANVLTLGGTLLGPRLALEVVETFVRTRFAGGRHEKRVQKIDALDAVRR